MLWKKLAGAGGQGGAAPTGISFVGSVTDTVASGGTTSVTLSGLSLQENDVLFLLTASDDNLYGSNRKPVVDPVDNPGWFGGFINTTDAAPDMQVWCHRCGSSPPTSVTVHGPSTTSDSTVIVQAFRGVDRTIFDAHASTSGWTSTSGTTITPPSITTNTNGAWNLIFTALDDDDTTIDSWSSGYTNTASVNTGNASTSVGGTIGMASKEITSAGTESPGTITYGSSDTSKATCIALKPDQSPAADSITEVGRVYYNSSPGSTVYNLPSGLQEDDYVLIFYTAYDGLTTPMNSSGWTTLVSSTLYAYWYGKVMGATPDTTVDLDDSTVEGSICIAAFRGVDTTTPQDVAINYSSSETPVAPSITTATNNALVFRIFVEYGEAHPVGVWPDAYHGHGMVIGNHLNATSEISFSLCYKQQDTAGSTGTATFVEADDSEYTEAATMALRPA